METWLKNDYCPELVGSLDKAKQPLDKKENNDLVLCMESENICTDKKK